MKTTTTGILMRCALAVVLAATPLTGALAQERQGTASEQEQQRGRSPGSLTVPITGTVKPETSTQPGSPVTGTFTIQRFVRSGDEVLAVGALTASFTDPATNAARTIVTHTTMRVDRGASGGRSILAEAAQLEDDVPLHGPAVAALQPPCEILHLVLGPLDLNLLGLRIQLNQVVLDITAVPGAGNLLGNLLCAIVGLLDGPGPVAQLVGLLNQLLAVLS